MQAGAESSRSVVVKHAAWWSGCAGGGPGGKAEVLKNGAAGFAPREYGEDAHAAAAGVADQDIDREHALEEVGPIEPTARGGVGPIGTGRGHDGRAEMVIGREDTMIAGEMTARWRDERREATQEIERRERELGATVAQRTLEGDDDAPRRIE
jgi:hypothetical protein